MKLVIKNVNISAWRMVFFLSIEYESFRDLNTIYKVQEKPLSSSKKYIPIEISIYNSDLYT